MRCRLQHESSRGSSCDHISPLQLSFGNVNTALATFFKYFRQSAQFTQVILRHSAQFTQVILIGILHPVRQTFGGFLNVHAILPQTGEALIVPDLNILTPSGCSEDYRPSMTSSSDLCTRGVAAPLTLSAASHSVKSTSTCLSGSHSIAIRPSASFGTYLTTRFRFTASCC